MTDELMSLEEIDRIALSYIANKRLPTDDEFNHLRVTARAANEWKAKCERNEVAYDQAMMLGMYKEITDLREQLREAHSLKEKWKLTKLISFKEYVHDRLDKAGVPVDPEPTNNAEHGCRIEGRLNYVFEQLRVVKEEVEIGKQICGNAMGVIAELQNKLHLNKK
jgi:hypothetical protein